MDEEDSLADEAFLTLLNAMPVDDDEQRRKFQETKERWKREEDERKKWAKTNLFFELRKQRELAFVRVEYDGCGDSGQVEEVAYLDSQKKVITIDDQSLHEAVEEYVYSILPGGWEINEGSEGTVEIDVAAGKTHVCHSQRVEEEYTEEFDE